MLTQQDFEKYTNREEFLQTLKGKLDRDRYDDIMYAVNYEKELIKLQAELVDLQQKQIQKQI